VDWTGATHLIAIPAHHCKTGEFQHLSDSNPRANFDKVNSRHSQQQRRGTRILPAAPQPRNAYHLALSQLEPEELEKEPP
jgi:hypothetical protein